MKQYLGVALGMVAGSVLGAGAITALHAQAKPPAYFVVEINKINDAEGFKTITQRPVGGAEVAKGLGGRYLVRGAAPVIAEGDWPANCRIVIVEFPSMERLRAWYASADYADALAVRQTTLDRRLLFVDGAHISPGLGWPDTAEGQHPAG